MRGRNLDMASLNLVFNPHKALKKTDIVKMAKMIEKAGKDPKIDGMIITITDDRKDGPNSMSFPFKLV